MEEEQEEKMKYRKCGTSILYPSGSATNASPFIDPASGALIIFTPSFSSRATHAYTSGTATAKCPVCG